MEDQTPYTHPETETALEPMTAFPKAKSSPDHVPISVESEASLEPMQPPPEGEPALENVSALLELENSSGNLSTSVASETTFAHAQALQIQIERLPGYLTVREAARIMGVSERSVYGYVQTGKLSGKRIDKIIVVVAESVETYERRAPGRIRVTTPSWHIPPLNNLQFVTRITARLRPGQGDLLERRLSEIRASRKHCLFGTAARYIVRDEQDPGEIEIVLVWRSVIMPSLDERESALAAFYNDLADIIDCETASRKEGRVLLHA